MEIAKFFRFVSFSSPGYLHKSRNSESVMKRFGFVNCIFIVNGLSERQILPTLHLTEDNLLLNAYAQISISESVMERLGFFKCSFFKCHWSECASDLRRNYRASDDKIALSPTVESTKIPKYLLHFASD